MGAKLGGIGTDTLTVEGVEALRGVEYEIIPDRIVAGTLLLAGAATRGDVTVTRCNPEHLRELLEKLEECGVETSTGVDWARTARRQHQGRNRNLDRTVSGLPDRFAAADVGVFVPRVPEPA